MTIRFKVNHRQYKAGDVTDAYDEGTCRTLIQVHRAEEVAGESRSLVASAVSGVVKAIKRRK